MDYEKIYHPMLNEFIGLMGSGIADRNQRIDEAKQVLVRLLTCNVAEGSKPIRVDTIWNNIRKFSNDTSNIERFRSLSNVSNNSDLEDLIEESEVVDGKTLTKQQENIRNILIGFLFEVFVELWLKLVGATEFGIRGAVYPEADYGVDLYAKRDATDKVVAIQNKFRSDPKQPLTSKDFGSFMYTAHANGTPYETGCMVIITNTSKDNISRTFLEIPKNAGLGDKQYEFVVIDKKDFERTINRDILTGNNRAVIKIIREIIETHLNNLKK